LDRRFPGYEMFLDVFLLRAEHSVVLSSRVEQDIALHQGEVRDAKDAAVLASTILPKPNFVVTGDKTLREDMRRCRDIAGITTICSSIELLKKISKRRKP